MVQVYGGTHVLSIMRSKYFPRVNTKRLMSTVQSFNNIWAYDILYELNISYNQMSKMGQKIVKKGQKV